MLLFSLVTPVYSLYFCTVLLTRFNKLNDDDDDDELKRFCHVADNSSLTATKVAKIQPLYDALSLFCCSSEYMTLNLA